MRGLAVLLAVAACGDDGAPSIDAPPSGDAPVADASVVDTPTDAPSTVVEIACPGMPAATIATVNDPPSFDPAMTSIQVGDIVQFTTGLTHNVVPSPNRPTDPGLMVGFNQTKCLQFTQPGMFHFICGPHRFTGSVTVVE